VGGEEFCVADILRDDQINGWAEAVRNAIAATPFGILQNVSPGPSRPRSEMVLAAR